MVQIKDLRGEGIKKESNTHTKKLEDLIENSKKHKTWTKIKKIAKHGYSLIEMLGAGYLAGYVISGGDTETATQFMEYSAVLYGGVKLGIELPINFLQKKFRKVKKEEIEKEKIQAESLEKRGKLHQYKPKEGLDFLNHDFNQKTLSENEIKKNYLGNLEGAKKPVRRLIRNVLYGALVAWGMSLIVDLETNVIDWVGPNPIEKGLELTHYILGQIEPLKDYISLEAHEHIGDFNQMQMLGIGAAVGAISTVKEFLVGNYQRIRAKYKK